MTGEEKYNEFVNIVCEMLGFNKPIDILKLCQITSDFVRPYEMKIKELEKENELLIIENEEMKKGLGCETCQIHLEFASQNNKIRKLGEDIDVLTKKNAEKKKNLLSVGTQIKFNNGEVATLVFLRKEYWLMFDNHKEKLDYLVNKAWEVVK